MKPRLVIERGDTRGHSHILDRPSVEVGRELSCRIWLPDASLRPRHAEFQRREKRWFVRALEEFARVKVNGLEVREAALSEGDLVELGDEVAVRFERASGAGAMRWALWIGAGALALAAAAYFGYFRRAADRPEASPPSAAPIPKVPAISDIEALSRRLEEKVPETPVLKPPDPDRPDPLPGGVSELPGTSVVHDELSSALEQVNRLLAEGQGDVARARAAALTSAYPNALPVWAALAQAEETSRNLPAAQDAWLEVLRRTDEGYWYDHATREISRLTNRQMNFTPPSIPAPMIELPEAPPIPPEALRTSLIMPAPPAVPPLVVGVSPTNAVPSAPEAPVTAGSAAVPSTPKAPRAASAQTEPVPATRARTRPVVKIRDVQMRRFPPGESPGDQRMLDVCLTRTPGSSWIHPERVSISVEFFDQLADGSIRPSQAKTSPSPITLSPGAWPGDEAPFSFSYSLRENKRAPAAYHGYRVRLFYDGVFQDAVSKPESLGL
ncbi:MAG: FHA domain-containing protein [Kiritimatiellae bacterium]|nr:FHA domain-containing protein [Kiritimatiellia bacterium]